MSGVRRVMMVLVGLAVLAGYTGAALGGALLWRWVVTDPPPLGLVAAALGGGTLLGGYLAYRLGTARLVGRLDATRLPASRAPELYRRLDRLCAAMDLDQPPILVADLGAPSALSLGGPRQGAIVLDRELMSLLTVDEIEGIVAHELAHIEASDTFVQTLLVSAVRTLVSLGLFALLPVVLFVRGIDRGVAWMAGRPRELRHGSTGLVQRGLQLCLGVALSVVTLGVLAYSRRREFAADRRAGTVTGRPMALARALVKVERAATPDRGLLSLLYVGRERTDDARRLLSTHPPLAERVERLADLADESVSRQHLERLRVT